MSGLFASNRCTVRFASVVALATLLWLAPSLSAQDEDASHPAHVHAGTCAELGDVVVPLNDVALPSGDHSGSESAHPVKVSEGNRVDMPLQEIIDGGHAINVHLSADEIGTYIACGDIGGIVHELDDGSGGMELNIALAELNDSGHVGTAWLGDDGEGGTIVAISLIEPDTMAASAPASSSEATPAAEASAESAAVEIKDFAFNPPTIEIPVGGSVTWTNNDNAPHTATGLDREALQSGTLDSGASYTQTFDTAGTYDYFCEFHANMKGSVVVA
jgi:plastocyanin